MMCETSQLVQAGLQPGHFMLPLTEEELASPPHSAPSSFQCLMEKVLKLEREMSGNGEGIEGLALPYVGPRTHLQFLECFCEIFRKKNSEAIDEKKNLRYNMSNMINTYNVIPCLAALICNILTNIYTYTLCTHHVMLGVCDMLQ